MSPVRARAESFLLLSLPSRLAYSSSEEASFSSLEARISDPKCLLLGLSACRRQEQASLIEDVEVQ